MIMMIMLMFMIMQAMMLMRVIMMVMALLMVMIRVTHDNVDNAGDDVGGHVYTEFAEKDDDLLMALYFGL